MPLITEYWIVVAQSTQGRGSPLSVEAGPFKTEADAFSHACDLRAGEHGSLTYSETIHVMQRGLDAPTATVIRWGEELDAANREQANIDALWNKMKQELPQ